VSAAVVIGVGSAHGDDAFGPAVARRVAEALRLAGVTPDEVRVRSRAGDPARLIEDWDGAGLAVVVDAVRTAAQPGRLTVLETVDERDLGHDAHRAGSHGMGVGTAAALAATLDRLPHRLSLVGVTTTGGARPEAPMSAEVAGAVAAATETVLRLLGRELPAVRAMTVRRRLQVTGVVQGVGFRPYVHALATRLGLGGTVGNDEHGVHIEVEGTPSAVAEFTVRLPRDAPFPARVDEWSTRDDPPCGTVLFRVAPSTSGQTVSTVSALAPVLVPALAPPDVAVCPACLAETQDPTGRRFRYPFTSCAQCGPRFSMITALPYDRIRTSMAAFPMCPDCRAEYEDPADRRFHAQSLACPACGPRLSWEDSDPSDGAVTPLESRRGTGEQALAAAQETLRTGGVVAVKGLGGYHLACDARNRGAVERLRARKARAGKPFALMARDESVAAALVELDESALAALRSPTRPIVVAPRRPHAAASADVCTAVAPGSDTLGVMLPYTPLHHLLLHTGPGGRAVPDTLVMTSGNLSDEPIAYDDADARTRLADIVDGFLTHDRPITVPCDDSVVRSGPFVPSRDPLPVRRSRGYAPLPVALAAPIPPVLAVGAELKNTLCLAAGRHAWLSQHIGDLSSVETLEALTAAAAHLAELYGVTPGVLACDAHPDYLGSRWARQHAQHHGLHLDRVQHHHAHVASLLAESGADAAERIIGVAFDGTGYGTDGAAWGGEFLLASLTGFTRAAHLSYVPLPGGDAAVRRPYRMALSHLSASGLPWDPDLAPVIACPPDEAAVLTQQIRTGLNCVPTSSMGRLFDAVSSLLGVRHVIGYEAQAAIELEALAGTTACLLRRDWGFAIDHGDDRPLRIDSAPVIRGLVDSLRRGHDPAAVALAFHDAVAEMIATVCARLAARTGLTTVGLSGGVFANVALLNLATAALSARGLTVLTHRLVPPNDGGLSLGQAAVAGVRAGAPAGTVAPPQPDGKTDRTRG